MGTQRHRNWERDMNRDKEKQRYRNKIEAEKEIKLWQRLERQRQKQRQETESKTGSIKDVNRKIDKNKWRETTTEIATGKEIGCKLRICLIVKSFKNI